MKNLLNNKLLLMKVAALINRDAATLKRWLLTDSPYLSMLEREDVQLLIKKYETA